MPTVVDLFCSEMPCLPELGRAIGVSIKNHIAEVKSNE